MDVFKLNKSVNPKNVLHYETFVEDCKLVTPYVNAYWVMGEEKNQTKGLNIFFRPSLGPKIKESREDRVRFTLGAIENINIPGSDKTIQIELDQCKPKATIVLNGETINLQEIHADLSGLSCNYIIIKGHRADGSYIEEKITNK